MSQAFVRIINGSYRNSPIQNVVFPLVKPFASGANGNYVTVDGTELVGRSPIRIKVSSLQDIEMIGQDEFDAAGVLSVPATAVEKVAKVEETDEQVMERIAARFDILHEMTKAACAGDIRAMIVTGPPGVGKSFGVEAELERASIFDRVSGSRLKSEVVKGAATPIGLYQLLYKYSDKDNVLVFDDADQIFFDPVSLNLLKSALDTSPKRKISWLSESNALRRDGIPDSFYFKGSVIFITNLSFKNVKSKSLKEHLEALESRCHIIDLTIETTRDRMLRIKQIANTGELFNNYDFTKDQESEIIDFLFSQKDRLREISLRTAIKLADLYKAFPGRWKSFAEVALMKSVS